MQQIEPNLPVFWSHGVADQEVPLSYGEDATRFLRAALGIPGDKIVFRSYDGLEHTVNEAVMADFAEWLTTTLA